MRILIAPDKFKDSLGAREVAENIARGVRDALPNAAMEIVPVADGGEGTAEVIGRACSGEWVMCRAHDAFGRAISARYVWLRERKMAVMEMSEAAGIWRLAPGERDPLRASSFGVGEMLLDAARREAAQVIVGLGGSATNDGGFGVARALGYRFFADQTELTNGPAELVDLTQIVREGEALGPGAHVLPIIAAADVQNSLLGTHGATRTFGRQKGATPLQLELLEKALTRLSDVVRRDLGCDFRETAGAGAAGGLGFGLMSFCGATVRPGFDLVAQMLDLREVIQRADVVITGEGRLDEQTLDGKAPAGVAQLARERGKPVYAIVGSIVERGAECEIFDGVFVLAKPPITREESIKRTAALLRERAKELGSAL
jgi:glycerate kinase